MELRFLNRFCFRFDQRCWLLFTCGFHFQQPIFSGKVSRYTSGPRWCTAASVGRAILVVSLKKQAPGGTPGKSREKWKMEKTVWINFTKNLLEFCCNILAPPGGLARLGTMPTVTTCDEYPQPFVVLVVMVLILLCFSV